MFLGHLINSEGIKVDPSKEKAIREMPAPIDRKSLRRFLAMVNYLSRFSPLISEAEIPLRELDKGDVEFVWTRNHQRSFQKIKQLISSSPVLALFDLQRRHRVTADASSHTVGAALLQYNEKGEWQPVAYASRKLTDAERRYGQIEKEALAITWACEKFDFYLVGRHFEIETDHKPLIPLLGTKDLSDLPLRVQRFKMRLMRYSYEIFHTPGSKMFIADLLSRPPSAHEETKVYRVEMHAKAIIYAVEDGLLEQIKQASEEDEDYQVVLGAMTEGWPSRPSAEVRKVQANAISLTVVDGMIMMNSRIYIPKAMRSDMLRRLHAGHQGMVRTDRRSKDSVWWPTLRREIKEMVETCTECIKHRRMQNMPLKTATLPEKAWEEVSTDLFEFQGKHYAIIVDYYSRWIEVVRLTNQTGQELVKRFKPLLARFGAPTVIRSDNGPCYVSKEWKLLMDEYAIRHITSSPHHHQSNGLAERYIETIKSLWNKEKDKDRALLAYRTTSLESGNRPDELMLGRRLRNELPIQHETEVNTNTYRERDTALKERQRENYDRSRNVHQLPDLKAGDKVWVKIEHRDRGRAGIVRYTSEEPDSYWVEVEGRLLRRTRRHLRLLYTEEGTLQPKDQTTRQGTRESITQSQTSTAQERSRRVIKKRRDPDYVYYK
jgi:transposase InsO family protein